jgi:uncharacterized protein with GYD domain
VSDADVRPDDPSSSGERARRPRQARDGKGWLKKVQALCPQVKWLAHYAILGPYDFMDIYEAPDIETAHKVSIISRAEGAVTAESWQALPYERFLQLLEQVEP